MFIYTNIMSVFDGVVHFCPHRVEQSLEQNMFITILKPIFDTLFFPVSMAIVLHVTIIGVVLLIKEYETKKTFTMQI